MNIFERNCAGQREANARGVRRHGGRANGFDVEYLRLQIRGDAEGGFVGTKNDGNNRRIAGWAVQAASREFSAKNNGDVAEMRAAVVSFADESQGRANLMRDVRRGRGAENETAGMIDEIVFYGRAATNKSATRRERFSAGTHSSEDAAAIWKFGDEAAASTSANADGVSFVDD